MTTPRDNDLLRADDETRVDHPTVSDPAPGAPGESRAPLFPSVGGTPAEQGRGYPAAPFAPVRDDSVAAAPLISDTARPVAAAPVGGRAGRWRWIAAAVATLAVLALGAGVVFFGARPATPSLVAQFAPADAAAFAELRMDLPGDQRDKLASFMSNFPGFADPATFQQKIDDTLANALRSSGAGLDWYADIQPWFGGQIGIFSSSLAPTQGTPPSATVVLSVKDRARLDELVAQQTAASGMQQEDYKGQTVWSGSPANGGTRVSFAVMDEALVISARNEDLKAALDIKSGEVAGLADDQFFVGQLAHMHDDRLALFHYDSSALLSSMTTAAAGVPVACLANLQAAAAGRLMGEVRAEADHLAANMRSEFPSGGNLPAAPSNKRTGLAESMPTGTLAYMEMRQVGAGIRFLVGELMSCLGSTAPGGFDLSQIEQLIGTAPENYFNFLDDAAIGLTLTDGRPGGGLVATVDDENVARARVTQLLSLVRLAGGLGEGLTIEEQEHGDATITVISFDGELMPQGAPPSISVTVAGGRLYLGLDDFVTTALDRAAADSLASSPRLQQALSAAGAENAGIIYVDIGGIRRFLEATMPTEGRANYETQAKPFIEPVTHFVVVSRNESGINAGHAFLYVE